MNTGKNKRGIYHSEINKEIENGKEKGKVMFLEAKVKMVLFSFKKEDEYSTIGFELFFINN